jgi:hypothetical protein
LKNIEGSYEKDFKKSFHKCNEFTKSMGCVRMAFSFGDNQRLGTQFGDEA